MQGEDSRCDVEKCVNYSKNFCSCLFSHIGLSGLVVAYTILGGFLFYHIEISAEISVKEEMQKVRASTEKNLSGILSSVMDKDFNSSEITTKIQEILNEHERIITDYIFEKGWNGRYELNENNWSYEGSILYSVTVITTIGYGHVAPKTVLGRVITIFYALFGIPLTILYLNNIGDYLAQIFRMVYSQLCHPLCTKLLTRKKRLTNKLLSHHIRVSDESSNQIKSYLNDNLLDTNTDFESISSRKMSQSFTEPLQSIQNAKINCWGDLENLQTKLEKSLETEIQITENSENEIEAVQSLIEKLPVEPIRLDNQNTSCHYAEVIETVPLTLTLCIMVIYIIMGAFLFTFWGNERDYFKWSYFCFITLSTIGFGDIVPDNYFNGPGETSGNGISVNDQNPKEKLIVSVLYVAIGLPVFAMCFKLMEDEIVNKVKLLAIKIGIIKT